LFIKNTTQLIVIAFILFSHLSCSNEKTRVIVNGVYYWKTVFELNDKEKNWIESNEIKKIYTRFFDVDWDPSTKQAMPVGSLKFLSNKISGVEIIPTIFITNKTFLNIPDSSINDLAFKVYEKIKSQVAAFKQMEIKEIQMDCDWTEKTKEKYFSFIKYFKISSKNEYISISATIRLHQVKYFEITGVPPVDRGSLMFYNMTSISDPNTKNSIFDEEVAKKYLVNFDRYPLKLDVILPAFSWGVLFRNNKINGIINDVKIEELSNNENIELLKSNLYRVVKNIFFHERYLKKNDQIRIEEITPETTELTAELIAPYIRNDSIVVSIYHLNKEVIKNYDKGDIQDIVSNFQ
jgi:hypothetical protein